MEADGKSVQVANMEWAEVVVKGIIEEAVIDSKQKGAFWLEVCTGLPRRPLGASACGRSRDGIGVWEKRIGGRRVDVRREIEAIWMGSV